MGEVNTLFYFLYLLSLITSCLSFRMKIANSIKWSRIYIYLFLVKKFIVEGVIFFRVCDAKKFIPQVSIRGFSGALPT